LIEAAKVEGVEFWSGAAAVVGEEDDVQVTVRMAGRGQGEDVLGAQCVIVADGLAGTSLAKRSEFAVEERLGTRIGMAATLDHRGGYAAGSIWMTSGTGGYVGVVRLEDGRLNVAAALDPGIVKARGGPGAAASCILHEAGMPRLDGLGEAKWKGTPGLTRRRCVESGRVLVVGDAAGYVEPFTGEGMAWAVACGEAVAAAAVGHVLHAGLEGFWRVEHQRIVRSRQRVCGVVAWAVRRPRLTAGVIRLLSIVPEPGRGRSCVALSGR
jgi:flavin-dependent dehydrogenase